MKKTFIPFAAAAILLVSCGSNTSKDSVEKADSANAAKTDTSAMKTDTPGTTTASITTDPECADFLVKAANGAMAEVKLARLAKDKAKDSAVQHFADMMISDHGAAGEKVKALAAARNVTLPAAPGADEQKKADDLAQKTGADFDKAYVNAMVKGHEETLDMFKKAAAKVTDAPVKAFIDNTIPVIEHHLMRIKDIKKGMR